MRLVISPTGRVGCIVPSGIATDDTTKFFFRDLMESHTLVSLYDFDNTAGIFVAVDSRYKFCLLTLAGHAKPAKEGAQFAFFLHGVGELQEHERCLILSARDLALINPNTRTCPIFRSKRDFDITKNVYTRVPILIKEGSSEENPWGIKFASIFHMSNDSHLFRTREQLEEDGWTIEGNIFHKEDDICLPLYEGKMISHFDHRFGGYEVDELDAWQHNDPLKLIMPRYWVHESHMPYLMRDGRKALLGFRDVARSTDIRTALFIILPVLPCGNNLPIVILEPKYKCEITYLSTCTSSFVFDFIARQKLGGIHMNFFLLKQLPVLPPDQYAATCKWDNNVTLGDWIFPRALELTYTAWDLEPFAKDCGYDGPPFRWNEERRFLLRCELDAAYFHLYGIERDDVDYIMETFPIVKRKDEKAFGEYRTKRVILEVFDEMRRAMELGEAYRTRLVPPPADRSVAHEERKGAEV